MRFLVIALLVISAGCATQPLSEAEKGVRLLRKSDPEKGCKELGKVTAPGLGSMSDEGREADLKRAAYKAGGDTVTVDNIDENRTYYGTAFRCSN